MLAAVKPPTRTSMPDDGMSVLRRRLTRSVVALSCGELNGNTCQDQVPGANSSPLVMKAMSVSSINLSRNALAVSIVRVGSVLTRISGPVPPAPNPRAIRSYALRAVLSLGRFPVSPNPSRIDVSGAASRSSTSNPRISGGQGRRWMNRLHRYQNCCCRGFRWRCGRWIRSDVPNRRVLTTITRVAITTAPSSAKPRAIPVKTPTNESSTNAPTAIAAALDVSSIRWPANPIRAGSSVIEASIINKTLIADAAASPRTNDSPMMNSPNNEMITVMPAKMTARPEESTAWMTASSGSRPACRCSR